MFDDPFEAFGRWARAWNAEDQVTIAVSGGLDSMVLLDVARRWCVQQHFNLRVIHINHQQSPQAANIAHALNDYVLSLGIACDLVHLNLTTACSETLLREARYQAFTQHVQAGYLLLGHHQRDQQETLFMRLFRGTSPWGLSGMPEKRWHHHLVLIRPFLQTRHAALQAWHQKFGLPLWPDVSNQQVHIPRNAVRHDVFPVLERFFSKWHVNLERLHQHFEGYRYWASQGMHAVLQEMSFAGGFLHAPLMSKPQAARYVLLWAWLKEQGLSQQHRWVALMERHVQQKRAHDVMEGIQVITSHGSTCFYRGSWSDVHFPEVLNAGMLWEHPFGLWEVRDTFHPQPITHRFKKRAQQLKIPVAWRAIWPVFSESKTLWQPSDERLQLIRPSPLGALVLARWRALFLK